MVMVNSVIGEDYWEDFEVQEADIEFLYTYLLEQEVPQTTRELVTALVGERVRREIEMLQEQRSSGGVTYLPKERYEPDQTLVFPALNWRRGKVLSVRPGHNPDLGAFEVIRVEFENGETREFAAGLENHALNQPRELADESEALDPATVLEAYGDVLCEQLDEALRNNQGFVRIAGKWFPRSLLVDINIGHLNLAEAVLDMAGGGPLPTSELIKQIGLNMDVDPRLVEFSLDLALQEDGRFDEVGPAGDVLWFLQRLEPEEALEPPVYLRYSGVEYDRSLLTPEMLELERLLDDELSPLPDREPDQDEAQIPLIFPHWRSGTLPLSSKVRHLFPTAYEAPRIRFILVDGDSGEEFPGWVVREKRYVTGLKEWYEARGLMPGSIVKVRRGNKPGQVIIDTDSRRSAREWIRTVLVGSDSGIVFAMLKQIVNATYDERMAIAVPDVNAIDQVWAQMQKERPPFERVVVNTLRELAKLTPQSHVHATELYAAVNMVRRVPPGPLLALLAERPWFVHVGDLHFRFNDSEYP